MISVSPSPDKEKTGRCCFCRGLTRFWFLPKHVACCKGCATMANPEDVPSLKTWMRREDIANDIGVLTLCGKIKTGEKPST